MAKSLLLGAVAVAALMACEGGEDASLEEYLSEVETLARQHRAEAEEYRLEEWARTFEEPEADEVRASLIGIREAMERFVASTRDLDPPPEAEDEHRALIEAGDEYVQAYEDYVADTADATTTGEMIEAPGFVEIGDASSKLIEACAALYEIADENGITVDLRCGGIQIVEINESGSEFE